MERNQISEIDKIWDNWKPSDQNDKRYFLVFYHFSNREVNGNGNLSISTKGEYLSIPQFCKDIKEHFENEYGYKNCNVCVTNIIELNEKDWKQSFSE